MSRRRTLLVALGTGALAIILLMGYLIWTGYREAIAAAEVKTSDYAEILEARLDATLRRADAELQRLARTIPLAVLNGGAVSDHAPMKDLLQGGLVNFRELYGIGVFDANGEWRYASTDSVKPANIADRGYFRQLRDNPQAGLVFSEVLVTRTSGRPGVSIARVLRDGQGVFRGIVVALLELDHYRKLFQALDVGAGGSVAIYRSDNFTQVLRWPVVAGKLNTALPPGGGTQSSLAAGKRTATFSLTSATDGTARIYSSHALKDHPFFVVVGVARDDVLAAWRARSLVVSLSTLLLMGLLTALLFRLWRADTARDELATIVEHSNDAIFSRALDGTILTWNAGAQHMLGYSAAEAIGKPIAFTLPPDRTPRFLQNNESLSLGAILSYESSRMSKDGRVIDVLSNVSPIRNSAGTIIGASLMLRDITALNQAQAAIKESEARFRDIAEAADGYTWDIDLKFRYTFVSEHSEKLFGYLPAEMLGRTPAEFMPPGELERINRWIDEHKLADGTVRFFEHRSIKKSGQVMWQQVHRVPRYNAGGALIGYRGVGVDITERKQAEDYVAESEARFRANFEQAAVGIAHFDLQNRNIKVNRRYCEITGYAPEELHGRSPGFLNHPEDADMGLVQRAKLLSGAIEQFSNDKRYRRKDGKIIWVTRTESLARNDAGAPLYYIRVVEDISDRKAAEDARASLEAQLRESQKMEAIGTLAGGIAHDFNNMIATILGNAELARQDTADNPRALESLEEIRKASTRARDLVQQILAFSRRQPTARKPIDLAPVVAETVHLLRATLPARLTLEVHCEPETPAVLADATQIEQVLLNLATNAMQAIHNGTGRIAIRLDSVMLDAALVEAQPRLRELFARCPGRTVRLALSDNGPGMDAATLARIFEPFFTTKPVNEGTGLGLSVVHGIVQAHEGVIVVESQPDKGAVFTLYLPLSTAQAGTPESAPHPAAPPIPDNGPRVLHIDDDAMPLSLFKRFFERRGYRVAAYTDSRAALDALRTDPATFDLVLTDYNMPGLSGLDVAREVQMIRADLPVAVLSGFIEDALHAQADAAGVCALISKADPVEAIYKAVQRLTQASGVKSVAS